MEKLITIDVDYIGNKENAKWDSEMYDIKVSLFRVDERDQSNAFVTGTKSKLINWLKNVHHRGENNSEEDFKEMYGFK